MATKKKKIGFEGGGTVRRTRGFSLTVARGPNLTVMPVKKKSLKGIRGFKGGG